MDPPPVESIRILHVDDEPGFAEMASEFLSREDDRFDIENALNTADGLAKLESSEFDCIISDFDMPDRNGIEFLEEIRTIQPDLPFILFTGKGSEEIASEAISAGVTDYLQKQGGLDQFALLGNRIENAVTKRRTEEALRRREASRHGRRRGGREHGGGPRPGRGPTRPVRGRGACSRSSPSGSRRPSSPP